MRVDAQSFGLRIKKDWFFDRAIVADAVDKATKKVLSMQGAYVRTAARHRIKAAAPGVHAKPGESPKSHEGSLKRFLYFAFNPANQSVLVGPQISGKSMARSKPIPAVLEYGGMARVPIAKASPTGGVDVEWKTVNLKPRPFMGPALEASKPKLAEFWKNAVTA